MARQPQDTPCAAWAPPQRICCTRSPQRTPTHATPPCPPAPPVQPLKQLKLIRCRAQGAAGPEAGAGGQQGADGGQDSARAASACPRPCPPPGMLPAAAAATAAASAPVRAHSRLSSDQVGTTFCARLLRSSSCGGRRRAGGAAGAGGGPVGTAGERALRGGARRGANPSSVHRLLLLTTNTHAPTPHTHLQQLLQRLLALLHRCLLVKPPRINHLRRWGRVGWGGCEGGCEGGPPSVSAAGALHRRSWPGPTNAGW